MTVIGPEGKDDGCSSSSLDSSQYTKEYRSTRSANYYGSSTYRNRVVVHNHGGRNYEPGAPHPHYRPSEAATAGQSYTRSSAGPSSLPDIIKDDRSIDDKPTLPPTSHAIINLEDSRSYTSQPQVHSSQYVLGNGCASNYEGASKAFSKRSSSKQKSSTLIPMVKSDRLSIQSADDSPVLFNLSTENTRLVTNCFTYRPSHLASILNLESPVDCGSRNSTPALLSSSYRERSSSFLFGLCDTIDSRVSSFWHEVDRLDVTRRHSREAIRSTSCDSSITTDSTSRATSITSTVWTAPPRRRSVLPTSVVSYLFRAPPDSTPNLLPCEFAVYSDCAHTFALDETEQWIEHSILHLQDRLPMRCMCWFCDDFLFDAREQLQDKRSNFINRMDHIRNHILDDHYAMDQMRPDYYFLKHLKEHGLISERLYQIAWSWNESPAPSIGGIYDHNFVPPEILMAEENSQAIILKSRSEDGKRTSRKSKLDGTTLFQGTIRTAVSPDDLKKQIRSITGETLTKETSNRQSNILQEDKVDHGETGRLTSLMDTLSVHSRDSALSDANLESGSLPLQENKSTNEPRKLSVNGTAVPKQLDYIHIDHSSQSSRSSICLSRSSSKESLSEQVPVINQRKQEILDNLIIYVTRLLRTKSPRVTDSTERLAAGPTAEPYSSTCSSSGPEIPSWGLSHSSRPGIASKKRKAADNLGEEEEESDDDTHQHEKSTGKGKETTQLRFACPYFKYDPAKYGSWQNCCGPGWHDIHRVKEHLYRRHKQPKWRCMRCCNAFTRKEHLEAHAREARACLVQPPEPIDGFDESQETLLRSRKPAFTKLPEYEKWREVFKILFPHINPNEIPSPFYDHSQAESSTDQPDWSTQREAYLLQELPLRIKTAIEEELGSILNIDENIFQKAAERCVGTILHDFTNKLSLSSAPPPAPDTTVEGTHDEDFVFPEVNAEAIMDVHGGSVFLWNMDGVSDFFPGLSTGFSEFEPLVSFEQIREDLQSSHDGGNLHSDSGYGSQNVGGTGKRTTELS